MQARIEENLDLLRALLNASELPFDQKLRSSLPESHGIYRIFEVGSDWSSSLRVGRTKSAGSGLRQRIYQNHLMGDQSGNIRAQLASRGRCANLDAAKEFLRERCRVQILVIKDDQQRKWTEHFALSVLQPDFSD